MAEFASNGLRRELGREREDIKAEALERTCSTHASEGRNVRNVAYRAVAKQQLCKHGQFRTNTRNIHAHNNRTTGLQNPFISRDSVNTFLLQRVST